MRRAVLGAAASMATMAALAAAMAPLRDHLSVATAGLVLVVPVVLGVVVGGFIAGAVAVAAGFVTFDVVFIKPYGTLTVGAGQNWVALVVYVVVMLLVARTVARLDDARQAARAREQTLRRIFELSDLVVGDLPLPELLERVVSTVRDAFDCATVALLLPSGERLAVAASSGAALPAEETEALAPTPGVPVRLWGRRGGEHDQLQTVALVAERRPVGMLRLYGPPLGPHERDALLTFTNHIALTLERAQLREQALRAELLEEVDRIRTALVGAVSHDLRTPLATIKASASALLDPAAAIGAGDARELLGLIDAEADRLDRLVTNLLDLSRIQAGVLRPDAVPIAAVDLVTAARRGLGAAAERFHLDLPAELPLVDVDHTLIEQALTNVFENALRYSPVSGVVTVRARRRPDARVELEIADQGPGVAAEDRDQVFELFTRRGPGGGAGLGLAIAKAFVEAHGQRIWVDEAPGGGACFHLTLPAVAAVVVP